MVTNFLKEKLNAYCKTLKWKLSCFLQASSDLMIFGWLKLLASGENEAIPSNSPFIQRPVLWFQLRLSTSLESYDRHRVTQTDNLWPHGRQMTGHRTGVNSTDILLYVQSCWWIQQEFIQIAKSLCMICSCLLVPVFTCHPILLGE